MQKSETGLQGNTLPPEENFKWTDQEKESGS